MQMFVIVCNEEVGVLLSTRFIRRRNMCLYFSQRIFAFLSLIKNGEGLAGVSVHNHSPSPSAGACGSGPRLPRSAQLAEGNGQPALRHPAIRAETRKEHVRPFFFFRHFTDSLWHIPFWASCLHPAPKTQRSSNGKGQPPLFLSRGHPAHTPRLATHPAAPDAPTARSRATREELPGTPRTPGTTRLIPQPWNYKSQKALRGGPATD